MADLKLPLILASGSPRRKEILDMMGIPYCIRVSDVDETFNGSPDDAVKEISHRKAAVISALYPQEWVLAADTLVYADCALGKPSSHNHAAQMLRQLSGRWHSVFTGVTLMNKSSGKVLSRVCETRVHFVEMSNEEIEAYIASNEPNDKAGAYAIQGRGGMFIDRIEGSYSNVVGLPMSTLRDMLLELKQI